MAKLLLRKQSKQFWKEVNRLTGGSSAPLAFTIDCATGQNDICNLWKGHYENTLNSCKPNPLKHDVLDRLKSCTAPESPFHPSEISTVIRGLKNGKACGKDGRQSEHFKYGSDRLHVLLCLLFNSMALHDHLCQELMDFDTYFKR